MLALLAAWEAVLRTDWLTPSTGIHQNEDNIVRAEAYLARKNARVVLTGSSFTVAIPAKEMGSDVHNLGISGGSSLTGVELVALQEPPPELLLVEMSIAGLRGADAELLAAQAGWRGALQRQWRCLQRQYQPVALVTSAFTKWNDARLAKQPRKAPSAKTLKRWKEGQAQAIAEAVVTYSKGLSVAQQEKFRSLAEQLKLKLLELRSKHLRIVLFHIPHHTNVEATKQVKEVQEIYSQIFPAAEWEWILPPAEKPWPSSDGVHLDDEGALD
jgi:hypothetical protein